MQCESAAGGIRLQNVSGSLQASTNLGSIIAALLANRPFMDSFLTTGSGDITVFIPSNLAVTIRAESQAADSLRRIVSDFPGIAVRMQGSAVVAEGPINGGGARAAHQRHKRHHLHSKAVTGRVRTMKSTSAIAIAMLATGAVCLPPAFGQDAPKSKASRAVVVSHSGSYLGVGAIDIDDERAKALNLKEARGVEIKSVEDGSPAAKAGLKEGDVVLEFNGQHVEGIGAVRPPGP